MRKPIRLCAVVFLTYCAFAPAAMACQCDDRPIEELYRTSSLAFISRAVSLDLNANPPRMSFERTTVLKGLTVRHPTVALNFAGGDPTCTANIDVEHDYLVLARGNFDTGYATDFCILNQANSNPDLQKQIRLYLELQTLAAGPYKSRIGRHMKDLETLRAYVSYLLNNKDPEVALSMAKQAAEVSDNSWIDVASIGDAYLLLELPRKALEKFDDILEIQPQNQVGWNGRYRALAQMGRWSEVPTESADLSKLFLRSVTLGDMLQTVNLSGSWLEYVNATAHNLQGSNFSDARLIHMDFSDANLTGANFSKAQLRGAKFSGADLSHSTFSGAILKDVVLLGAKLEGTDFSGADLSKTDLTGVDLSHAKLDDLTKLPDGFNRP